MSWAKLYVEQVVRLACFVVLPHDMDEFSVSINIIRYSNMYSYQTMGKVDSL